jgi:putative hemolysin
VIPFEIAFLVMGVCVITEGFFSGSEIAVVSANKSTLRRKAADGDAGAKLVLAFLQRPQVLLSTTLLGTQLSVVTSTTVVTLAFLHWHDEGELVSIAILTPILLILGEIVPKTVFQQKADALVTKIIYPLRAASVVLAPLVFVVSRVTSFVAGILNIEDRSAFVTRDELRLLLETPEGGGGATAAIPESERSLVMNVLDFGGRTVYDVMVPLSEVTALPEEATLEEAAAEIADKQHTRIPIYRERVDQIIGILHAFDVLIAEAEGKRTTITELMRPPIFVPESKPTVDLLLELQRAGQQLAVVVDEYGGATGICTIEDILEEIVGEIEDEYDRGPSPIRAEGPGLWRVQARTPVSKVNQTLGIELPEGEDYETVAGLLLDRLKRIPREGETLHLGPVTVTIVGASDRAVEEVRIRVGKKK